MDTERMTLSIDEAATVLGISRAHAYELVREVDADEAVLPEEVPQLVGLGAGTDGAGEVLVSEAGRDVRHRLAEQLLLRVVGEVHRAVPWCEEID